MKLLRARRVRRPMMLRAALLAVLLALPTMLAAPAPALTLAMDAPARAPAAQEVLLSGRLALRAPGLAVGVADAPVELRLDGATVAEARTDEDGKFSFALALAAGPHVLQAVAHRGSQLETRSAEVDVFAFVLPGAPGAAAASFNATAGLAGVEWLPPTELGTPVLLGYRVYRAPAHSPEQEILVRDITGIPVDSHMSLSDTGHRAGTTYTYRIAAYSADGEGASAFATVVTPADLIDTLELALVGFRVCADTACHDVGAGGRLALPGVANVTVAARYTGFVGTGAAGREGVPVTVRSYWRAPGMIAQLTQNVTSAAAGELWAVSSVRIPVAVGACQPVSASTWAFHKHVSDNEWAGFSLCG